MFCMFSLVLLDPLAVGRDEAGRGGSNLDSDWHILDFGPIVPVALNSMGSELRLPVLQCSLENITRSYHAGCEGQGLMYHSAQSTTPLFLRVVLLVRGLWQAALVLGSPSVFLQFSVVCSGGYTLTAVLNWG